MRALELSEGQLNLRTDYPAAKAPDGSVRVRIIQAGICETDLQLVAGYMGFQGVPGHEFVGIPQSGQFAGQRVVGEINCVCHVCSMCQRGLKNHCPNRSVIGILNHDGAFADNLIVPECNLHPIDDSISDDLATLVEPVAAAFQIPAQVDLSPGMRAVVVGDGRLGNLCAQVLKRLVDHVVVIGKHPTKIERFRKLDIETCLLQDLPADLTADIAVDCAGSPSGFETALRIVRPRGTLVMKTTVAAEHQTTLAKIVIDEITVTGSRCGPFTRAIDAIRNQELDLDQFITARFPIEDFAAAFDQAKSPESLKVIIKLS